MIRTGSMVLFIAALVGESALAQAPAGTAPAAPPRPAVTPPAAPRPMVARPPSMTTAPAPSAAPAPAAPPPAPGPKPAPELDQLKFLRGRWRCVGVQFANALYGPEHRFVATAESKPAVDGFWDHFTYEELRSKEHHGFKAHGLWGWEQSGKHLVRTAATSAGDWDVGAAPGLEGDKIVWTGEVVGPLGRTPYRHTFTRKSDREWSHSLELKDATGKYGAINDVTCKR